MRTMRYNADGSEVWHADCIAPPNFSQTVLYQEPKGTIIAGGQANAMYARAHMLLAAYSP